MSFMHQESKIWTRQKFDILPCYLFSHHPTLTRDTQKSTLFEGSGEIRFQDGRSLVLTQTPPGIEVQIYFTAPNGTRLLISKGLVKWDDLPGNKPSAHAQIARAHPTSNGVFYHEETGTFRLPTPHYTLYLDFFPGKESSVRLCECDTNTHSFPIFPTASFRIDTQCIKTYMDAQPAWKHALWTYTGMFLGMKSFLKKLTTRQKKPIFSKTEV